MKKIYIALIAGMLSAPFMAGAQTSDYTTPSAYNEANPRTSDNYNNNLKREATASYYRQQRVQNQVGYINGDFGTVRQGESIATFFVIPAGNAAGKTGLRIGKVYAGAQSGITYATAVKNQSMIEVGFDATGKSGKIDEVVTVYTDKGTYYLKLTGLVNK